MLIIVLTVIGAIGGIVLAILIEKCPKLQKRFLEYVLKNVEYQLYLQSQGVPDWAIKLKGYIFWPTAYLFMQLGNKVICMIIAQFVTGYSF